jgi:hypothetical protein
MVLYPNPTRGKVAIEFESLYEAQTTLQVYDVTGRVVVAKPVETVVGKNVIDLDMVDMAAGLYTVTAEINGQRVTAKLVRE